MQSKTSFFNKTVFKKNLTRFAPVWGVYTLCLVLGTLLIFSNGGTMKQWHFAKNMSEMPQYMAMINLVYAPIVAQLLFGDLYNSRMCNALHAMPVRRESMFFTNLLSGLTFSVVPGIVMAVLSTLLCGGSLIRGAWQIPWLTLAASTLEFVCYYGIAVFATMCAGNRLGMLLIYALLNSGAFIAYWLVGSVYTRMLYGVITPDALAEALTPIANMLDNAFITTEHELYDLKQLFGEKLEGAFCAWSIVPETWQNLLVWAAAGVGFALVGLVLYKKRDLECAGDVVAFKVLEPVFQVLGSVVCAAAAQFFLYMFLSAREVNYLFLAAGLVVGWFACRMLIERSSRVFRVKNWIGLAGLTAVITVSLFLTHVDILGIETWQPDAEEVASVEIGYGYELTDKEDIQKLIDLQSEALETRLESGSSYGYLQEETGEWVMFDGRVMTEEERDAIAEKDGRYAFHISFVYYMESGKEVARSYTLWADGQGGDNYREIMSRWEYVNWDTVYRNGQETEEKVLDVVLSGMDHIYIDSVADKLRVPDMTQQELRTLAESFVEAVKADCAEGTMAQNYSLHQGHFREKQEDGSYYYRPSISVGLYSKENGWNVEVYPDSRHCVQWLQEHDMLNWEVRDNILVWY